MSAICGILGDRPGFDGRGPLQAMMKSLAPHGPDGGDCWNDERAFFGHQMLHTTPESLRERLPFCHAESRVALTADARLDNREDLLRTLGVDPRDAPTDSELILKAFLKWGTGCAERLIGEFTFAVWDAGRRTLHCVTDPMGIRPLFFHRMPEGAFAFASEVRPLLQLGNSDTALCAERLAMLGISALTVYLESGTTCFEGIYRVPAASVLTVSERTTSVREYWSPDPRKRLDFRSDDECYEALREVFGDAVRARLRSAFPIAAMLSGGLDSSSITATASRLLEQENRELAALSSLPAPEYRGQVQDEGVYINLFAPYGNIVSREVCAPGCGPFDEPAQLVQSGSLCSFSFQHYLYSAFVRAAREAGARVILDGHGGELTASCTPSGYTAELLLGGRWRKTAARLRSMHPRGEIKRWQISGELLRPLAPYPLLRALNRVDRSSEQIAFPIQHDFIRDTLGTRAEEVRQELPRLFALRPDHRKNMVKHLLLERIDARQRLHAGFVGYQEASFSYPFLDRRVVEFSLAVDARFKQRGRESRLLLRRGMQGIVPDAIRRRTSKVPFAPDYLLRYEHQRGRAAALLKEFSGHPELCAIVDFPKTFKALSAAVDHAPENSMRGDLHAQFTVPYATYLCYFLSHFGDLNRMINRNHGEQRARNG